MQQQTFTEILDLIDVIVTEVILEKKETSFLPALEYEELNLNIIIFSQQEECAQTWYITLILMHPQRRAIF